MSCLKPFETTPKMRILYKNKYTNNGQKKAPIIAVRPIDNEPTDNSCSPYSLNFTSPTP